jgi:hypothetical protein
MSAICKVTGNSRAVKCQLHICLHMEYILHYLYMLWDIFLVFNCIEKSALFNLGMNHVTLYLSTPLQGVFKPFGAAYGNSENAFTDESEVNLHQRLEKLYLSTRAAKV